MGNVISEESYFIKKVAGAAEDQEESKEQRKKKDKSPLDMKIKGLLLEKSFLLNFGDLLEKVKDKDLLKRLLSKHEEAIKLLIKKNKIDFALDILNTKSGRAAWFTELLKLITTKGKAPQKKISKESIKRRKKKCNKTFDEEITTILTKLKSSSGN